ncbi:MAG: ABC transporter ATP-binding protein [Bacteroidota bacterium]
MIFQAQHIEVGYDKKSVLKAEHLQIEAGNFYFLLGKNGSGKSTLLRSLIGIQKILTGDVELNGNALNRFSRAELSKRICFVQSQNAGIDYLSVFDYVAFGRMPYTGYLGKLSTADFEKVDQAIELLGIQNLKERMITELSDGEFRKCTLAQAFCQETDILFVDEPTAHLDIAAKSELFHLLKKMSVEKGRAIVVASHEVQSALIHADEIWLIDQAEVQIGSAKALLENGAIDRVFGNEHVSFKDFLHQLKSMKIV